MRLWRRLDNYLITLWEATSGPSECKLSACAAKERKIKEEKVDEFFQYADLRTSSKGDLLRKAQDADNALTS